MNFALLVSQGDSDSSDIVQIEPWVVLMEVRGYPAHPNTAWLLTREDPHWVVVLHRKRCRQVKFNGTELHQSEAEGLHITCIMKD